MTQKRPRRLRRASEFGATCAPWRLALSLFGRGNPSRPRCSAIGTKNRSSDAAVLNRPGCWRKADWDHWGKKQKGRDACVPVWHPGRFDMEAKCGQHNISSESLR